MNKISEKKTKKVVFKDFAGIDARSGCKDMTGSGDIVNMRVSADGSLVKRHGYRLLAALNADVRAVWTGKLDGVFRIFALGGDTVSTVSVSDGSIRDVGKVKSANGKAQFFYYRTGLYLIDGAGFYKVTDTGLSNAFGYVPLVGKDWQDGVVGEAFEPRNILCACGRISYVISEAATPYLRLGVKASSVDAVFLNGTFVSEGYTYLADSKLVSMTGLKEGDRVTVYFTYSSDYSPPSRFLANTDAFVFGGINTSRPFIFGGDGAMMYSSAYVSENSLEASRKGYAESDALYFPEGYEFCVGDGRYPISAVSRHHDRLLIFTEGGAWLADSSACGIEEFPVMNINSSVGVSAHGAAAMLGNEPCTVSDSSIVRWRKTSDELDECSAYSISAEIDPLLPRSFFSDASVFADRRRRELIFCSPSLGDSAYVWSESTATWVRFSGVNAERFFDAGDDVGFTVKNKLYVFDEELTCDEGGAEIIGIFDSKLIDFESGGQKQLSSLGISLEGGGVTASIYMDGEPSPTLSERINSDICHRSHTLRLPSRRFSHLRLRLSADGENRQVIHSVYLKTR